MPIHGVAASRRPARCADAASRATASQADALDREGKFQQAAELFRQAWQACPAKAGYLYRAGHALWMAGDPQAALATLRAAVAVPGVPKAVRFQAGLEIAHLQALGGKAPAASKSPVAVAKPEPPPKTVPAVAAPKPPPIVKPQPAPQPAAKAPEPAAPVAAPAAPTPEAPPPAEAVTPPPPASETPVAVAAPVRSAPLTLPAAPPERRTRVGIAGFVVASVAALAALYFAGKAVDRQESLNQSKLPDSDAFDLTRIGKPDAVTRSNAVLDWWNAALGAAVVGVGGAATGAWFLRDPDDAGNAVRQSVGRPDGVD